MINAQTRTPVRSGRGRELAKLAVLARTAALVGDRMRAVERHFDSYLESDIPLIAEIGRYISQSGGKRVRPALLLLAAKLGAYQGDRDVLFASVFELIHTATLVHDDVIDGAATRRGRRSVNGRWGNHVTVLLGDYLYIKSMNVALTAEDLRVIQILAQVTQRMIEGELIQADRIGSVDVTEEDYLEIVRRKTADLFSGCCRVGALLGAQSAERQTALAEFGLNLGMAFQITDDILDLTSTESALGKPVASDLREGKVTLPLIYLMRRDPVYREQVAAVVADGAFTRVSHEEIRALLQRERTIEEARSLASEYARQAEACLEVFPPSPARDCLLELPGFAVERKA
jgi:octaprenyl-diphosphate synthase